MTVKLLSYTQHLEGIGHLVRSQRIAAQFARHAFETTLVSGGVPVEGIAAPNLNFVQLPPVKAGPGGFSDLRDASGGRIDDAYRTHRRDTLLDLLARTRPDCLMIEAFPFGRNQMRFELVPLLDAALSLSPRPVIVCSVRDILQENKSANSLARTIDYLQRCFDLVLVHGDPAFARLEESFPRARDIVPPIRYTGMVAGPAPEAAEDRFDVVISTGGGATGEAIIRCALEVYQHLKPAHPRWCVIAGPYMTPASFAKIGALAPDGFELFRFRNDLAGVMMNAKVSVSRGGYNTMIDLIQSRCRAVIIPHASDGETEQTRRADLMAARGMAVTLPEDGLGPEALAEAIDAAASMPQPGGTVLPQLGGAERSVDFVKEFLSGRAEFVPDS